MYSSEADSIDAKKCDGLPRYQDIVRRPDISWNRRRRHWRLQGLHRNRTLGTLGLILLLLCAYLVHVVHVDSVGRTQLLSTEQLRADHLTCKKLHTKPKGPSGQRQKNARFVEGNRPTLIKNATIWSGEPVSSTDATYQWTRGDILLEYGLIKRVEADISIASLPKDCRMYNARGRPLTAGIVDMHSHAGVDSLPSLSGNEDTNELSSDITPYVRSKDGIQPLDHQIQVIKSGGVTTSLILPGSGNNIGGAAYVIKHAVGSPDGRPEIAIEDMMADPDHTWRYIKMACGENAKRVYGKVGERGPFSRLGEAWSFRHAFEQARNLVRKQDDWCEAADRIGAENMPEYLPMELEWETLTAVLRGQVLVNTHCYTIPDLESFIGYTNEFEFEIQAFHHAHQTYLIPEVLKRAYGNHTPAAALFADNMYYKAEAYIGSEKAGKILYENGITPVYVSDNPVINSQHVVFEAAKAYKNGLPYAAAFAGVTSKSAELLGLGDRIGKIKPGFDADVVVWDSDPLSVGAAPVQVWIDGTAQYEHPFELDKPVEKQEHLGSADYLSVDLDNVSETLDLVVHGINSFLHPKFSGARFANSNGTIVYKDGTVACVGNHESCATEVALANQHHVPILDLHGNGYVTIPFTAFGSFLGLVEITGEAETQDGGNGDKAFTAAVDGLAFQTKNLRVAYEHGVTRAITAPQLEQYGGHKGISAGFLTDAAHALENGAIWESEVAVHYTLTSDAKGDKTPSTSSMIGALAEKLAKAVTSEEAKTLEERALKKVVNGTLPLVITVHSADVIASLLRTKAKLEENHADHKLRLVVFGGAESHLVAKELAATNTSVILAPLQPYSESWDQRRSLTGAPMTNRTHLDILLDAGVKVAIGTKEDWETRDLNLFAGIAYANCGGRLNAKEALDLVSTNVYEILGIENSGLARDEFVVFEGDPLEIQSRVRAVADGSGRVTSWS